MIKYKNLLTAACALSLSIGVMSTPGIGPLTSKAEAKELIFNVYAPRRSPLYKILFEDFAKRIEAETKGAVTVKIPSASLAPPARQWQIVTQGVADVVSVPRFSQRNRLKLMRIAELPFHSTNSEASSIALSRTFKKYFSKSTEFNGVKLLALVVLPGRHYINGKRPIKTMEDFAGLKLWATAGPLSVAVKVTGATAVPAPFPKLFEFASKGTIDGMVISQGSVFSAGVAKFSKYITTFPGGVGTLAFALVMNKDSWKGLSASEKSAIEKIAESIPSRFGKANDKYEKFVSKKLGLSVTKANDALVAEMKKRLAGLTKSWLKTAKASGIKNPQAAIDFYRAEMAKITKQTH